MKTSQLNPLLIASTLTASLAAMVFCAVIAQAAPAVAPSSKDPRAILRAALDQAQAGQTLVRMKMTIKDGSGKRERVLTGRSKRFAEGRKSLILIEGPADLRNTGFLSIDYASGKRGDEQWLYLPKLHRTTRVPSSGKSDSFVGSDFSYADMSQQDPDQFELKLLEFSTKVDSEDCWLIEATPRGEKIAEETGYSKSQIWVSKGKLVPLQIKGWTTKDANTKYFKASDVRNVDGLWTPHRLQMRTLKGSSLKSETLIEVLSVDNDSAQISDADFTRERLERGL